MKHPRFDDVRAAVDWALSHDLAALLAYRQVAHLDRAARWQAGAALVARWRKATACDEHASLEALRAPAARTHC